MAKMTDPRRTPLPFADPATVLPTPRPPSGLTDCNRHLEDPAVLDETDVWVDRDGRSHVLAAMPAPYLANVVNYLERHASAVEYRYTAAELLRRPAAETIAEPWRIMDPLTWLRTRPLVVAARRRLEWPAHDSTPRLDAMGETIRSIVDADAAQAQWSDLTPLQQSPWVTAARCVDTAARRPALADAFAAYRASALRTAARPALADAEAWVLADKSRKAATARHDDEAAYLAVAARRLRTLASLVSAAR